jgi:putative Mn2+ efflux pump MntP
MGIGELLLIAVGLSADAFAVSLCKGLCMKKLNFRHALIIALFFGVFQAAMPVIGWAAGIRFKSYIENFDHWVAFALLAFIGLKMLWEAFKKEEETTECEVRLNFRELLILAVATSIDALAVGFSFAILQVKIIFPVVTIGVTTFLLSFCGVYIGHRFGMKFKRIAEIAGSLVLILIGVKILLDHLG